jgi:citrate lyase gamma subunit
MMVHTFVSFYVSMTSKSVSKFFNETIFETIRCHLKKPTVRRNRLQAVDYNALIEQEVTLPAARSALARRLQYKPKAPTQKSAQLATHQEKT